MGSRGKSEQTTSAGEAASLVIADDRVQRIAESNLVATQIGHLTRRLHETPDFKRDPTGDGNQLVRDLVEQRVQLLQGEGALPSADRDGSALQREALLLDHSDLVSTPWAVLNLGYAADATYDAPGIPGTSGTILSSVHPGGVGASFELRDIGSANQLSEKWWVRTWTCSAVFPDAPFSGRVNYRFQVDTQGQIYYAPVHSGLFKEFVSAGRASDTYYDDLDDWWTVATPISLSLPYSGDMYEPYFIGSKSEVSGSIEVEQGKNAGLGLIFGLIIAFADGGTGGYSGMRTEVQGQPSMDGEIEYRYIPDWWIKVIDERLPVYS